MRYLTTRHGTSTPARRFLRDGRFYVMFADEAREERYGFYCSNCGTFTDSVDGLGKIVCEKCDNEHRPEEWDASYL